MLLLVAAVISRFLNYNYGIAIHRMKMKRGPIIRKRHSPIKINIDSTSITRGSRHSYLDVRKISGYTQNHIDFAKQSVNSFCCAVFRAQNEIFQRVRRRLEGIFLQSVYVLAAMHRVSAENWIRMAV